MFCMRYAKSFLYNKGDIYVEYAISFLLGEKFCMGVCTISPIQYGKHHAWCRGTLY